MREGKYAVVAMRDGAQPDGASEPVNAGNALLSLTKDDIGVLWGLALSHRVTCIKLAHEKPGDELHANELKIVRRICDKLETAFKQKPA